MNEEIELDFSRELAKLDPRLPDPRLEVIKQKTNYEDKTTLEKEDGLLMVDFRKTKPPRYVIEWSGLSNEGKWTLSHNSQGLKETYRFKWEINSDNSSALIFVSFFNDYQGARNTFLYEPINHSAPSLYLKQCGKEIGTVCTFCSTGFIFIYKNVYVRVLANGLLPDGSPLNEALALWVFEQLKKAPKVEALPTVLPPLEKEK